MPDTLADAGAKPNAADAAVKASADATAKAAADKVAADKKTADDAAAAAAAAQTPEQKAAADKAAADKVVADKAAAETKYDLKVPEGSKLDAAFVERTAAIARELGLDQKGAEKLLARRAEEATGLIAERDKLIASWQPGGEQWEKRDTEYRTGALADKELGAGDKDKLTVAVEKVQIALNKFGDDELRKDLLASGWGSKPSVLRMLARIGRAMGEGAQITGSAAGGSAKKTDAQIMFPDMYNEDGSPKT